MSTRKFVFIWVLHIYAFVYMLRFMDKQISTLLREVKEATAWTEARIAEEIGTSQPTVNRILNGQDECKIGVLRAIEALHARVTASVPPAAADSLEAPADLCRRNAPNAVRIATLHPPE